MHSLKGYSLLELMMAVLLFGITALSVSLPISNSMYLTYNNKQVNTASGLARTYLKDVQDSWKIQSNYDNGILISPGNEYTDDGNYTVSITSTDLESDDNGNVILRRVNATYEDGNQNVLCDIYLDYNRPGSI